MFFGAPAAVAAATGALLIRSGVVFLGGALFAAGVSGLALTYLLAQAARLTERVDGDRVRRLRRRLLGDSEDPA